jgi:hypothetical protein
MTNKYISLLTVLIFLVSSTTACTTYRAVPIKSNSYTHISAIKVGDKIHIITNDGTKHVFVVEKITDKEIIGADDSVEISQITAIGKFDPILTILILVTSIAIIVLIVLFPLEFLELMYPGLF